MTSKWVGLIVVHFVTVIWIILLIIKVNTLRTCTFFCVFVRSCLEKLHKMYFYVIPNLDISVLTGFFGTKAWRQSANIVQIQNLRILQKFLGNTYQTWIVLKRLLSNSIAALFYVMLFFFCFRTVEKCTQF